jgi:hypothetical protein
LGISITSLFLENVCLTFLPNTTGFTIEVDFIGTLSLLLKFYGIKTARETINSGFLGDFLSIFSLKILKRAQNPPSLLVICNYIV